MVPKPDGTCRMCVDYRALNDCTPDTKYSRDAKKDRNTKPKIFGTIDLIIKLH